MGIIGRVRRGAILRAAFKGNRFAIVIAVLGWLWRRTRSGGAKAEFHEMTIRPGETVTISGSKPAGRRGASS